MTDTKSILVLIALVTFAVANPTYNEFVYIPAEGGDGTPFMDTLYWEEGQIGKCTAEVFTDDMESETSRPSSFYRNPGFSGKQPTTRDYTHSGWDRGHIAPSADFRWDEDAVYASHYVTNISPQDPWSN